MQATVQFVQWNFGNFGRHSGYHRFIARLRNPDLRPRVGELEGSRWFAVPSELRRLPAKARARGEARILRRVEAELDVPAQPAIVHYLYAEWSLWIERLRAAARPPGSPRPVIVATFHMPAAKLARLPLDAMLALVDHVIVVSREQAELIRRKIGARRVSVMLHGIDTAFFRPAPRPRGGPFRILAVGSAYRAMNTIIGVARRLQDRSDLETHILSTATVAPQTVANITFHPRLDDRGLRRLYQRSDALFLPLADATANNAILEAIACGTPVIVSDLRGVREYVSSRVARFVETNTPARFIAAIDRLQRDPEARLRMGEAGRARAEQLGLDRVAAEHDRLYRKLLSE
jgi:glycosyltransferase involved in cell wall biosynthesis